MKYIQKSPFLFEKSKLKKHIKLKIKRKSKNKSLKIKSPFQIFSQSKIKKVNNNLEISKNNIQSYKDWDKYYEKEIENHFRSFASKIMENLIKNDFINNSIVNRIKSNNININLRYSLINYLFHIVEINKIDIYIYFLTIEIFDLYFEKNDKNIDLNEGKILLITCFLIAFKLEGIKFFSSEYLSYFYFKDTQFSSFEIEEKEKEIYQKIGLIFYNNSFTDYFSVCIFDFQMNLKNNYPNYNCLVFEKIQNVFVYNLKLLPLDLELFYSNKHFLLIIVSLIFSFDLIRNHFNFLENEFNVFYEWAFNFLKFMNYDINLIKKLYNDIETFNDKIKINVYEIWNNNECLNFE